MAALHLDISNNLRGENRSEEHTSELQSRLHLVCRLLLEKKNNNRHSRDHPVLRVARDPALHAPLPAARSRESDRQPPTGALLSRGPALSRPALWHRSLAS